MTEGQMTKNKILVAIQNEWQKFQSTLELLSESQMLETGVENGWNVKDILTHITAWELRMVEWIEESLRGETPDRPTPGEPWDDIDLINQQIYKQHKDTPLYQVLEEFQDIHKSAYKKITSLTEKDLFEPGRFAWRAGNPLWHMVADNTWRHYKEHHQAIQDWMKDA